MNKATKRISETFKEKPEQIQRGIGKLYIQIWEVVIQKFPDVPLRCFLLHPR
jgi:hypothetical protein